MKKILGLAACSFVVLLSACGSSTDIDESAASGNTGTVPSRSIALASKADALRELNISSALASQVAGGGIGLNAGGASSKRVRALSFNASEREPGAPKSTETGNGNAGGSFKAENDLVSRDFVLFENQSHRVTVRRRTDEGHKTSWTGKDGVVESLTLSGVSESGRVEDTDVPLSYDVQGQSGSFYSESYEKKNAGGTVLDTQKVQFLGTSEVQTPQGGPLDARAILSYRYAAKDGNFFNADIGEAGKPFKVTQGDTLSYGGNYAYAYKGQAGGKVLVSTETPIALDSASSRPSAGKLKFVSGSDTITITFKSDGGADLDLNGRSESASAQEIRNALLGEPG